MAALKLITQFSQMLKSSENTSFFSKNPSFFGEGNQGNFKGYFTIF